MALCSLPAGTAARHGAAFVFVVEDVAALVERRPVGNVEDPARSFSVNSSTSLRLFFRMGASVGCVLVRAVLALK